MFELTEHLRQSGLNLNENKSGVISAASLIREETALDRLFSQAHESVQEQLRWSYGFDAGSLDSNESQSDTDVSAVETLFHSVRDFPKQADKIVRFCLPVLRAAKSPTAVEYVLENLVAKPYLSRLYLGYLQWFLDSEDVRLSLEKVISTKNFIPDYQLMYIFAALMRAPKTSRESVKLAIKTMSDSHKVPALRAIAAICSAIHGTPQQKQSVRLAYEGEPSPYVKSAILYASRWFTTAEQRTCKRAWGGHSAVNSLLTTAMSQAAIT
jgi:hypothetical protein